MAEHSELCSPITSGTIPILDPDQNFPAAATYHSFFLRVYAEGQKRLWVTVNSMDRKDLVQGEIKFLEPDAEYGVIESDDGRYLHFQSNCVKGVDFNCLLVGDRVVFSEKTERQLPLATEVFLAGTSLFTER